MSDTLPTKSSPVSNSRATRTARRTIALTKQDPIERLKEFCKQSLLQYRFTWDFFSNGILIECSLFFTRYGNKKIDVTREARFVPSTDLSQAQRIVSAVLLDRLGLGDEPSVDMEDNASINSTSAAAAAAVNDLALSELQAMTRNVMKMANTALGNMKGVDDTLDILDD